MKGICNAQIVCMQKPDNESDDDFAVLPTDNLLVVGKAEEDYSSIEVHGELVRSL